MTSPQSLIQPTKNVIGVTHFTVCDPALSCSCSSCSCPSKKDWLSITVILYFMTKMCCWWYSRCIFQVFMKTTSQIRFAMQQVLVYYALLNQFSALWFSQEELDLEYGPFSSKCHILLDPTQLLENWNTAQKAAGNLQGLWISQSFTTSSFKSSISPKTQFYTATEVLAFQKTIRFDTMEKVQPYFACFSTSSFITLIITSKKKFYFLWHN